MKGKIRIASGQGFWGDWLEAPIHQVTKGPIDYLVMDYLAEVTMSILQKQKKKDPNLGYARDLVNLMERILPIIVEKDIKVVTNGGGVNPIACRDAIFKVAQKLGIKGLKIGVVIGDDILDKIDDFIKIGIDFRNMDTGESIEKIPVAEALRQGAQIVVTGRVTDTGITLAPMIYEFNWSETDYDKLASGIVAGHILECGAQATGGNFSYDWRSVPDMAHIGFPIAEAYPNGEIVITKHENTGGLVTIQTVTEQLVYEIGDPSNYITPEVIADFTTIKQGLRS